VWRFRGRPRVFPKNGGYGGGVRLVSAARSVIIVVVVGTSLPARLVAGGRGRGAGSARPPCHGYAGPAGQRARPPGHAHRTRRPALLAGRLSCSFTPPPPPSPYARRTTPLLRGAYISLTRARSLYALFCCCCYYYYYYSFHALLLLLHLNTSRSTPPSPLHSRLLFTNIGTCVGSIIYRYIYIYKGSANVTNVHRRQNEKCKLMTWSVL